MTWVTWMIWDKANNHLLFSREVSPCSDNNIKIELIHHIFEQQWHDAIHNWNTLMAKDDQSLYKTPTDFQLDNTIDHSKPKHQSKMNKEASCFTHLLLTMNVSHTNPNLFSFEAIFWIQGAIYICHHQNPLETIFKKNDHGKDKTLTIMSTIKEVYPFYDFASMHNRYLSMSLEEKHCKLSSLQPLVRLIFQFTHK
jgi:hypothetical protein